MTELLIAVQKEVRHLHDFFEKWFRGEIPATKSAFAVVDEALASEFRIVSPRGVPTGRESLLGLLFRAHGTREGQTFEISTRHERCLWSTEEFVAVSYEEWQVVGDEETGRLSSAVLRRPRDGEERFSWMLVHETWLPEAAPKVDSSTE